MRYLHLLETQQAISEVVNEGPTPRLRRLYGDYLQTLSDLAWEGHAVELMDADVSDLEQHAPKCG
jgi:hypothetical protein